ncbi:MAG TPA: SgcJ/EcaC family oxidoreductase [Thermoanaerobaculia bacterium]|nr:SgcJ/EcaC family oxidoreductase [Thermoanaerobaculia bacterium]
MHLRRHRSALALAFAASFLGLLGLLGATACRSAAPAASAAPPSAAEAEARRQVEAAMERYTTLLRTGPPEALAACFTAQGELLEPGMAPLQGPEAIRAFLAPIFTAVDVLSASATSESVEVHGDAAYQWGTYRQRVAEHGKPPADYQGRYVAAWRREADGQWRLRRMLVQPFPGGAS